MLETPPYRHACELRMLETPPYRHACELSP